MVQGLPTHGEFWPNLMDPFRRLGSRVADMLTPVSEAAASDDAYVVEVELPGVKDDDIKVEVHGDMLTLSGEKRSERDEKTETYIFSERSYGSFQRSFKLPPDVDAGAIEAHAQDGVLKVTLPKLMEPKEEKRRIVVKSKTPAGITGDPKPNFE